MTPYYKTEILKNITTMAPGRTCLFGDQQDYLGLPVIACAIDRHIQLKATKNDVSKLVIDKPGIGERMYPHLKDCPVHTDRNEKELPTAFLNMLKDHPRSVVGLPFSEHVPDLTAKEDILDVKNYLEEHYAQLD